MIRLRNKALPLLIAALATTGCKQSPPQDGLTEAVCDTGEPKPGLGLMTSLPVYWPAADDFSDLASREAEVPWQRELMEKCHTIVPLDTLSPTTDEPGPLIDLEHLAVIQPRGLSPADNVALDDWVQRGGRLLLALDPVLAGEYDLPLGDPGRPVDTALIPPVVKRWGLEIRFDEQQSSDLRFDLVGDGSLPVLLAGEVSRLSAEPADCEITAGRTLARCAIGKGRVTIVADATAFEVDVYPDYDGPHPLLNLMEYSFQDQ